MNEETTARFIVRRDPETRTATVELRGVPGLGHAPLPLSYDTATAFLSLPPELRARAAQEIVDRMMRDWEQPLLYGDPEAPEPTGFLDLSTER